MKPGTVIYSTLGLNLIVGNLILTKFSDRSEKLMAYFVLHLIPSLIAILLLLQLFKIVRKWPNIYLAIIVPVMFAFLVPVLSTFSVGLMFTPINWSIESIPKSAIIALIAGFATWKIWLPFGLLNSVCLAFYSKRINDGPDSHPLKMDEEVVKTSGDGL